MYKKRIKNKKKYYAVKDGLVPGVYKTWDECQKQVHGYSCADYRVFYTLDEAYQYLGIERPAKKYFYAVKNGEFPGIYLSWPECQKAAGAHPFPTYRKFTDEEMAKEWLGFDKTSVASKKCSVYVDGSFNAKTGVYGYGVVLCYDDKQLQFSGSGNKPNMRAMRNVAGECEGAMRGVREALAMKCFDECDVYYDYDGVEKWVTGAWKTNKPETAAYAVYMKEKGKLIKINFIHVFSHTGVELNELADSLAKEAVGIS